MTAENETLSQLIAADPPATVRPEYRHRPLHQFIIGQMETFQLHLSSLLETEDVEAIHKTRVTTRRLQASLDLIEVGKEKPRVRKLKTRLRKWRRALSLVRNYDVFLSLIEKERKALGSNQRQQFDLLKGLIEARRARMSEKIRRKIKKIDLKTLGTSLGLTVTEREAAEAEGGEGQPARPLYNFSLDTAGESVLTNEASIAGRAANRLEQRLREFLELAAAAQPATRAEELHELRISAKRLRYLMEIVAEMGHGKPTAALSWLRNLQDRIGDWHDLESIEAEIIEVVSEPGFLREHLAESGRMLQAASHLQNKKERLAKRLFPIRVPRTVPVSTERLVKSLRRSTVRKTPRA